MLPRDTRLQTSRDTSTHGKDFAPMMCRDLSVDYHIDKIVLAVSHIYTYISAYVLERGNTWKFSAENETPRQMVRAAHKAAIYLPSMRCSESCQGFSIIGFDICSKRLWGYFPSTFMRLVSPIVTMVKRESRMRSHNSMAPEAVGSSTCYIETRGNHTR
jgi:hypothetical protein